MIVFALLSVFSLSIVSTFFVRMAESTPLLEDMYNDPFAYAMERDISLLSRVASPYKITAKILQRPTKQPARTVLLFLSVIVHKEGVSQEISDSIVKCLANETSTNESKLGLFNADQFAVGYIQTEYYAFVDMDKSQSFRAKTSAYVQNKQLVGCVRQKVVGFSPQADILPGRTATEPLPNELKVAKSDVPRWLIGVIVGLLTLITMLAVTLIMLKRPKTYPVELFEPEPRSRVSAAEIETERVAAMERELERIAMNSGHR